MQHGAVLARPPDGNLFQFKYLAEGGEWFCDPDADAIEVVEFSVHNSVLQT